MIDLSGALVIEIVRTGFADGSRPASIDTSRFSISFHCSVNGGTLFATGADFEAMAKAMARAMPTAIVISDANLFAEFGAGVLDVFR